MDNEGTYTNLNENRLGKPESDHKNTSLANRVVGPSNLMNQMHVLPFDSIPFMQPCGPSRINDDLENVDLIGYDHKFSTIEDLQGHNDSKVSKRVH